MQQHGFARNLDWEVASTSANPNPDDPEPTVSRMRVVACLFLSRYLDLQSENQSSWLWHPVSQHTVHVAVSPQVELVLTENDYTLAMWPFKFKAVYRCEE